eukprot:GHVO01034518.1.p1 GENE.GHVO01034518.1~~GHVO01034518.1.p1  ORF type:complete len:136 (+),score=11.83 GHVO01034518.1:847-1254(+)
MPDHPLDVVAIAFHVTDTPPPRKSMRLTGIGSTTNPIYITTPDHPPPEAPYRVEDPTPCLQPDPDKPVQRVFSRPPLYLFLISHPSIIPAGIPSSLRRASLSLPNCKAPRHLMPPPVKQKKSKKCRCMANNSSRI